MLRSPVFPLGLVAVLGAAAALGVARWGHAPLPASSAPPVAVDVPEQPGRGSEPARHRVSAVAMKRGDNLVRALVREGVDHRVGNDIAAALKHSGVNLRKLKPQQTLEITWDLNGEPVAVRYEPSPWLGYAVVSTDGVWQACRSETRP